MYEASSIYEGYRRASAAYDRRQATAGAQQEAEGAIWPANRMRYRSDVEIDDETTMTTMRMRRG